jgi:hypothetical protein
MGTSHGDFTKYPRTPHLFGSKGTDDDKHLNEAGLDGTSDQKRQARGDARRSGTVVGAYWDFNGTLGGLCGELPQMVPIERRPSEGHGDCGRRPGPEPRDQHRCGQKSFHHGLITH